MGVAGLLNGSTTYARCPPYAQPTQRSHRKEGACGAAEAAVCGHASHPVQMRYVPTQNGLSSAGGCSTLHWPRRRGSASWSGLSVSRVIELARWGPMACMAAQERERGSWCSTSWVLGRQDCLPLCSEGSRVAVHYGIILSR